MDSKRSTKWECLNQRNNVEEEEDGGRENRWRGLDCGRVPQGAGIQIPGPRDWSLMSALTPEACYLSHCIHGSLVGEGTWPQIICQFLFRLVIFPSY
jgi:hypothetical protein